VRIRRHLSYANVVATLALLLALGGGAYALDKVNSREIVNGTIRSVDLKNHKGVHAADVKRNALGGRQIDERTLNASKFAPVVGDQSGDCSPSGSTFTECATTDLQLPQRARVLVIATGNQDSLGGPANATCQIRIDQHAVGLSVQPGEQIADNTSSLATNGFARTAVPRDPLSPGAHHVALACKELIGNVRIDVPTIAAIAIGAG
jgi:hypothetical protein